MNRNWRDLIGGLFLVPALHIGFVMLILLIHSIGDYNSVIINILSVECFCMGIAQFVYLIPVMLVYRRRQRFEVVKGISIAAMLTILVNGACFGMLSSMSSLYQEPSISNNEYKVGLITLATVCLMVITFYVANFRRKDRSS
jgi:hypothetical protein